MKSIVSRIPKFDFGSVGSRDIYSYFECKLVYY